MCNTVWYNKVTASKVSESRGYSFYILQVHQLTSLFMVIFFFLLGSVSVLLLRLISFFGSRCVFCVVASHFCIRCMFEHISMLDISPLWVFRDLGALGTKVNSAAWCF